MAKKCDPVRARAIQHRAKVLVESYRETQLTGQPRASAKYVPYDKRKLTYSLTFTDPRKIYVIRVMEWTFGKLTLLRRIRALERAGTKQGSAFFAQALEFMGIDLLTPDDQV
ncbi:MAG: hypothetical protein ACU0DI_04430, partial [Paracoccaceae bacterium]